MRDIIEKMLQLDEKNRISWEELFNCRLFFSEEEEENKEDKNNEEDILKQTQNNNKNYFKKTQVLNSIWDINNE